MHHFDIETKEYFSKFNEIFPEMTQSLVRYIGIEKTIEIFAYALCLYKFKLQLENHESKTT